MTLDQQIEAANQSVAIQFIVLCVACVLLPIFAAWLDYRTVCSAQVDAAEEVRRSIEDFAARLTNSKGMQITE